MSVQTRIGAAMANTTVTFTVTCHECGATFDLPSEWLRHQRHVHAADLGLVVPRPRLRRHSARHRRRARRAPTTFAYTRSLIPTPAPPRPGPRVAEARPWERYNSDGSINLGSYAVAAAEGMVLFAHDLFRANGVPDFGGDGPPVPSPGQIQGLARRLLEAADRTQAAARADGHSDRMDSSHTRARAAVRASVELHPVPWGRPGEYDAWVDAVVAYATVLLRATLALVA